MFLPGPGWLIRADAHASEVLKVIELDEVRSKRRIACRPCHLLLAKYHDKINALIFKQDLFWMRSNCIKKVKHEKFEKLRNFSQKS